MTTLSSVIGWTGVPWPLPPLRGGTGHGFLILETLGMPNPIPFQIEEVTGAGCQKALIGKENSASSSKAQTWG